MSLPRWRREQKQKRQRKFITKLRFLFLFLCLLLLLPVALFFLREINSSKLPKDFRQTVVLATNPILTLSFSSEGDLTIIAIPDNVFAELTHGFGSYRLGAAWGLGQQEKMSGQLLAESVGEFLGVPVDGWIGFKDQRSKIKDQKLGKDEILMTKNRLTSWTIFLRPDRIGDWYRGNETNLSLFDLLKFWYSIKTTSLNNISYLDLSNTPACSNLTLADGSQVLTCDQNLLDNALSGLFVDPKISGEQLLIEVLNSTNQTGLANRVGRIITNLGGRIIGLSQSQPTIKTCQLLGDDKVLKSLTAQRLSRIFDCQESPETEGLRSDLRLIIGENYEEKLYSR